MTYQNLKSIYQKNPLKKYYCVKNPTIINGEIKNTCLNIEIYQIDNFKNKNIYFKKLSGELFPDNLEMSYYLDSESEIFNTDKNDENTYSIFSSETKAKIQKIDRLNRFLISLNTFYDNYDEYEKENSDIDDIEDENVKKIIENIKNETKLPSKETIKKMIEQIEALNLNEENSEDDFLLNYL
jgi:hypothetical protein